MPDIKLQHIVSCSSADKNNPAENLLKPEGVHKWKCEKHGEKHASVVIQFEKSSQIHSLDIGNEGSAFVEVLVGRSTAIKDEDYEVIVVASSYMTPMESRNGTNRTSVRMFGADKLSKTVSDKKWDRVKLVCSQPFNKNTNYGLSFVTFHSPPEPGKVDDQEKDNKKFGMFSMKKDGDSLKTGSLFSNRSKEKTEPHPLTGAAAIRAASKLAEESRTSSQPPPQKRKLSTETTEHTPSKKRNFEEDKPRKKSNVETDVSPKIPLRKQSTSLSSTVSSSSSEKKQTPMKKLQSEPVKPSPIQSFKKLMSNVIFVMSGYQNPYRAELREKAVEMGAQYRPDWGRGCTHLICAFANTPKYTQVKGKGRIVSKSWISDCHKQKKLLPWRSYRLGNARSPEGSSEDEEDDDDAAMAEFKKLSQESKKTQAKNNDSLSSPSKQPPKKSDNIHKDSDDYGGDTDVDDSGDDTEDEIRRIKQKQAGISDKKEYGDSTDEDEDSGLPELPDFFSDKYFYLYGTFSASDRRLLVRYITAYNGEIEEYMNEKVNYVVTMDQWDKQFDDALSDNENIVFVKPKWIFQCHDKAKLIPHQPYSVVP